MKFRSVEDYDYGKKWIAGPINHGEGDIYFVRELVFLEGYGDEFEHDYLCSVAAVSPSMVESATINSCCNSMSVAPGEWEKLTGEQRALILYEYGCKALITQERMGNNSRELIRETNQQFRISAFLLGFVLDRPQNQIGSTGWDFLRGNITVTLYRPSQNTDIVKEMHGIPEGGSE